MPAAENLVLKTATNTIEVGYRFKSTSKTLTDAHFLFFSGMSGDTGKSHTDAEYAKKTRLGKLSAHGFLVASLTALGASDLRDRPDGFVFVEQNGKFLKPAVIGDTLTPQFEVERIWRDEKDRTFCRIKTWLTNQHEEKVFDGFQLYRIIPLTS